MSPGRLVLVFEEGRALRDMAKSLGREPIVVLESDGLGWIAHSNLLPGEGFAMLLWCQGLLVNIPRRLEPLDKCCSSSFKKPCISNKAVFNFA
jgi:hypothetical protein